MNVGEKASALMSSRLGAISCISTTPAVNSADSCWLLRSLDEDVAVCFISDLGRGKHWKVAQSCYSAMQSAKQSLFEYENMKRLTSHRCRQG